MKQLIKIPPVDNCDIFAKMEGSLKNKIGCPDLMVLFTNTMSHKMLHCALSETKGQNTVVVRSHSSSMAALKSILDEHALQGA